MFRNVTWKSLAILALKFLLAGALLAWLVSTGAFDLTVVGRVLTPVRFAIICTFTFILLFVNAVRWRLLLSVKGPYLKMSEVLPLSLIGAFFNLAMPGGMGGDVVKGYYLVKSRPEHKGAAIVSIIIDRLLGIYMLLLTASLAIVFKWSTVDGNAALESIAWSVFAFTFLFTLFLVAALSRRIKRHPMLTKIFLTIPFGKKIESLYSKIHAYRDFPKQLFFALVLSFFSQSYQILVFVAVAMWMGIQSLTSADFLFIVPVGLVATSLPISPAGVGVGQVAFYFLFNLVVGRENFIGPTTITAFQLTQIFWGIVGAFFYIRRRDPEAEKLELT